VIFLKQKPKKQKGINGKPFDSPIFSLVPPARLERAATGLGIRCSILLSYGGMKRFRPILPVRESYTKVSVFARAFPLLGRA
jgi:hypothetical protein